MKIENDAMMEVIAKRVEFYYIEEETQTSSRDILI
jgi:hypothetical protein